MPFWRFGIFVEGTAGALIHFFWRGRCTSGSCEIEGYEFSLLFFGDFLFLRLAAESKTCRPLESTAKDLHVPVTIDPIRSGSIIFLSAIAHIPASPWNGCSAKICAPVSPSDYSFPFP